MCASRPNAQKLNSKFVKFLKTAKIMHFTNFLMNLFENFRRFYGVRELRHQTPRPTSKSVSTWTKILATPIGKGNGEIFVFKYLLHIIIIQISCIYVCVYVLVLQFNWTSIKNRTQPLRFHEEPNPNLSFVREPNPKIQT